MPLSRRDVVATALGILDEYGLADLTMRRIAGALDVHVGALYHHVANKQSLLAAVAEEMLAGLPRPASEASEAGEASEVIAEWARALRRALLAHRDGAELVASALSMRLVGRTPAAGLAKALAGRVGDPEVVADTVVAWVIGHTMDEQGHAQLVALGVVGPDTGPADPDARFAAGVRLLVAGARATGDSQSRG